MTHLLRLILTLSLVSVLQATSIRVVTMNVLNGVGAPGEPEREALEDILGRINADVVGLQEVFTADHSGANPNLDSLRANLGYPHLFVPSGALDTQSRVILLSKYPFVEGSQTSIVSPQGANDVTRAAAAAIVDVPGTTNDPIFVTAHLKCCFDNDDPLRRAVEMIRIRQYLETLMIDGDENVFAMGDFNLLGNDLIVNSLPFGLPVSYVLGSDITFPVTYYADPTSYFTAQGLINPGYAHQDGITTNTFMGSGQSQLDHLLISNAIASRMPLTEIYNSEFDTTFPGLPKTGQPLSFNTNDLASDHFPLFGDFELDGGLTFTLTTDLQNLTEGLTPATLTVILDEPASETTEITLLSSAPCQASLSSTTLTISAGQTTASTTLTPLLDRISDGTQEVTITANGDGFQGGTLTLNVQDGDPTLYTFEPGQTSITENFDNFNGSQSLAAWTDNGVIWQGLDDGSGNLSGGRSYQGALGVFSETELTFSSQFRNNTDTTINSLDISFDAQQWQRLNEGSADRWEVNLMQNGALIPLPELTFTADTIGVTGALNPPITTFRETTLTDLNLAPNEEITLTFHAIPGELGNEIFDDIFINEFHYDNNGPDAGEFVEIIVAPSYDGPLEDIILYLYNGNNGSTYGEHPLNTFTENTDAESGARIFQKEISGIQNGAPDGLALVVGSQLREFISYEGSFTPQTGPAMDTTSVDIMISQGSSTPIGENSIARMGTANQAEDFTWGIQPGAHTPGELNSGQTIAAGAEPQGIAIDNLTLTIVPINQNDQDGDLLSDQEELVLGTDPTRADTDGDGQDDFFETQISGTDPRSSSSRFIVTHQLNGQEITVSFPSALGRNYQLETSSNLENWTAGEIFAGTGSPLSQIILLPENNAPIFIRVRLSLL